MMKVLIDTHIALWALMDDPKMPKEAAQILMDENNAIYYSTASVWEVAIKHCIRPEDMIVDGRLFEKGCEDNGYRVLPKPNLPPLHLHFLRYCQVQRGLFSFPFSGKTHPLKILICQISGKAHLSQLFQCLFHSCLLSTT